MKVTIALALVTSSCSQLGMVEIAELVYVFTAIAAWTYGGRAVAESMARGSTPTPTAPAPPSFGPGPAPASPVSPR